MVNKALLAATVAAAEVMMTEVTCSALIDLVQLSALLKKLPVDDADDERCKHIPSLILMQYSGLAEEVMRSRLVQHCVVAFIFICLLFVYYLFYWLIDMTKYAFT